jgi:hypothetical protein
MSFSKNINNLPYYNQINGLIPFDLSINLSINNLPSFFNQNKISQIDYDFGDGFTKTQKLTLDNNILPTLQTHQYNFSDSFKKDLVLKIKFYQFNSNNTIDYTINLSLSAPSLANLSDSYFDDINLVGTRMFGVDNNLVYIFETKNPNYLIPVMVNWNQRPETIISNTIPTPSLTRSYKMLSPFENEKVTSANNGTPIKLDIPTLPASNKPNPDNNSNISRKYP